MQVSIVSSCPYQRCMEEELSKIMREVDNMKNTRMINQTLLSIVHKFLLGEKLTAQTHEWLLRKLIPLCYLWTVFL